MSESLETPYKFDLDEKQTPDDEALAWYESQFEDAPFTGEDQTDDSDKKGLNYYLAHSAIRFQEVKDKIAQSKLGEWTKDKLIGDEYEERGKRMLVRGAVGLVAVAGTYGAWKTGVVNTKSVVEMGGPGVPDPTRFKRDNR